MDFTDILERDRKTVPRSQSKQSQKDVLLSSSVSCFLLLVFLGAGGGGRAESPDLEI